MEGTPVYNLQGKVINTIRHLVIGKVSGRVVYVVKNFGAFSESERTRCRSRGRSSKTIRHSMAIEPTSPKRRSEALP